MQKKLAFRPTAAVARTLINTRIIREAGGPPTGYITLLRPMEQVRQLGAATSRRPGHADH